MLILYFIFKACPSCNFSPEFLALKGLQKGKVTWSDHCASCLMLDPPVETYCLTTPLLVCADDTQSCPTAKTPAFLTGPSGDCVYRKFLRTHETSQRNDHVPILPGTPRTTFPVVIEESNSKPVAGDLNDRDNGAGVAGENMA